jgi:hypothetical protein
VLVSAGGEKCSNDDALTGEWSAGAGFRQEVSVGGLICGTTTIGHHHPGRQIRTQHVAMQ